MFIFLAFRFKNLFVAVTVARVTARAREPKLESGLLFCGCVAGGAAAVEHYLVTVAERVRMRLRSERELCLIRFEESLQRVLFVVWLKREDIALRMRGGTYIEARSI